MKITEISDEKYHYSSGYYTANKWLDSDRIVLARSVNQTIGVREDRLADHTELIIYSFADGSSRVLCGDVLDFVEYVVSGRLVYYTDGRRLYVIDTETDERRTLFEYETNGKVTDEYNRIVGPHITNDGKTLSIFACGEDRATEMFRVDTATGETKLMYEKRFAPSFNVANHLMVNPENPDLYFFAHEGITFYVSNRLWLYDDGKKRAWNIAKQSLNADGDLGDCYGHEMWSPDGKGLYFVKYACSPEPPRGICYVDTATGETKLLYSAFNYWHVGVSRDGRYLTSDTQPGGDRSEVILIDQQTGTETLIDRARTNWTHPCHPHPQLSPDNRRLVYTALNERGRTCVKVAEL